MSTKKYYFTLDDFKAVGISEEDLRRYYFVKEKTAYEMPEDISTIKWHLSVTTAFGMGSFCTEREEEKHHTYNHAIELTQEEAFKIYVGRVMVVLLNDYAPIVDINKKILEVHQDYDNVEAFGDRVVVNVQQLSFKKLLFTGATTFNQEISDKHWEDLNLLDFIGFIGNNYPEKVAELLQDQQICYEDSIVKRYGTVQRKQLLQKTPGGDILSVMIGSNGFGYITRYYSPNFINHDYTFSEEFHSYLKDFT